MGALEQEAKKNYWAQCEVNRNLSNEIFAEIYQSDSRLEEVARMNRLRLRALRGNPSIPPKISVVISALNERPTLPTLLHSIAISKGAPPTEVIVVDNGSVDNTASLSRMYGAKVIGCKQRGIHFAMNAGIQAAEGEIIFRSDADAFISPLALKTASDFLDGNPKIEAYFGLELLSSENGPSARVDTYVKVRHIIHSILSYASKRRVEGCGGHFVARKQSLIDVGLLETDVNLEDLHLALKFIEKGTMTVLRDKNALVINSARRHESTGLFATGLIRLYNELRFILGHDFKGETYDYETYKKNPVTDF